MFRLGENGQRRPKVEHKQQKTRFAWKQVTLEKDPHCQIEVQLLNRMKHENIVLLHEVYTNGGITDMILELCSGSLGSYISKNFDSCPGGSIYNSPASWDMAACLQQVLRALQFLHAQGVAHRDVKPDNVLFSKSWKLADFNMATEFKGYMKSNVGTLPYAAPEVHEGKYTEKCDLYSTGVVFVALATGLDYLPHMILDSEQWKRFGRGSLAFATQMTSKEEKRCSAQQALQNPWLVDNMSDGGCCAIS